MPNWRSLHDRSGPWLYAEHLQGREHNVVIEKVIGGTVIGEGGRESRRAVVHFKGKSRPLALNVTNAKTIAGMYGPDTDGWIGKAITLYVGQTRDPGDGQQIDCIRIRPRPPRAAPDTTPDAGGAGRGGTQ